MSLKKVEEYLLHLARQGYARETLRDRGRVLRRVFRGRFRLDRFLSNLPENRHSRMFQLVTVRSFLRFIGRPEEAERIPPMGRPDRPPLRPPSAQDVKTLLGSLDGHTPFSARDRAIVELIYSAGLRSCEVRRLELSSLDLGDRMLRVRGKGGKERTVPFGLQAAAWLSRYISQVRPALRPRTEALFVTRFGLQFTQGGMSIRLQHLANRVRTSVRVTAHALRRAAAAHCQAAGMNLREIQELLGHAELDTTVRYTGITRRELAQVIVRVHPRSRMMVRRIASSMHCPPRSCKTPKYWVFRRSVIEGGVDLL